MNDLVEHVENVKLVMFMTEIVNINTSHVLTHNQPVDKVMLMNY